MVRYLNEVIANITLSINPLEEIEGRKTFHDRHILTDIGGVSFSAGLDEGDENETEEISLLTMEVYRLRWNQYVECNGFRIVSTPP